MDKDVALEQIFDDLIFHETLNIIFDTHRAVKKGLAHSGRLLSERLLAYKSIAESYFMTRYLFYYEEPSKTHLICNEVGKDVFGNPINKIKKFTEDIECPSCRRQISSNRFAPHLEKCLGKGRSSSRIASQKITASTIEGHYSFNQKGEELLDGDWSGSSKEKKKTKRSKPKKNDSRSKKSKIS